MHKIALVTLALLAVFSTASADQAIGKNINIESEVALFSPPVLHRVIGEGRLYFYSEPNENNIIKDIFVIPGDELIAYEDYNGWYSVMYFNKKTGKNYEGWVKSKRLKWIGHIHQDFQ